MANELIRGRRPSPGVRRPARWLPRGGSRWVLICGPYRIVLYHYPHRGYYPFSLGHVSGQAWEHFPVPEFWGSRMKKRSISEGARKGGQKSLASQDTKFFARWPAILQHVADICYDDGSPRKPGTITLRTLGTSWQLTARDPDSGAQLVSLGQSIDEACSLLDKLLAAEDAPWELDVFASQGRKKK